MFSVSKGAEARYNGLGARMASSPIERVGRKIS